MSLQDDYYDLAAVLKGEQKRKLNRIWSHLCDAERQAMEANESVRLVNLARRLLSDKAPLSVTRKDRE